MKTKQFLVISATALLLWFGCKNPLNNADYDSLLPAVNEPVPPPSNQTLKETAGWDMDTLASGLIKYTFNGTYQSQNARQIINVIELDLNDPQYQIEFVLLNQADTLSDVAQGYGAIAATNGTYEADASFIKSLGVIKTQVTLAPGDLRFWKHEGAYMFTNNNDARIGYGTSEQYLASPDMNIISGAPLLIDNKSPVGTTFIGDVTGIDLNSLDPQDYRSLGGLRNPRTAVALTDNNKLLLVTIDGRRTESAGMTAKETTEFFQRYFDPKSALNLDGGGSSTMYIKGSTASPTGIVNYPTDNGKFDHYGQRMLRSFILIKKRGDGTSFAGGSGTEADPYLIATATHMLNMHTLDWSNTATTPLYFKLVDDIDMAGISWQPLNNVDPFDRHLHFDGNGHIIKNLTVSNAFYGSLFGVLLGSCKDLGVINANVSSTNGGGILAGYVGLKGPGKPTGIVENCFTSGIVSGTDAVGGIAANVGKPNGTDLSIVRNCYSTANVTATGAANSRAGGVVGIVYEKGVLENCYATGKVSVANVGAGGVVGWSDSGVKGLVALNEALINKNNGKMGRISSTMGTIAGVTGQGENCWALDGMTLDNGGTPLGESAWVTGTVTATNGSYDGETKTKAFLSNMDNYTNVLGWLAGPNQSWAQTMNHDGFPILQWQFLRGDYDTIH